MTKNILYISYDGLTDPLGQSQILPYIVGLSKEGYNFTIISAEKPENFDKEKNVIEKICKENNINWKAVKYTKKPAIISTVKDIKNIIKTAFELHKKYNFSAVHSRSYIASIVAYKMQQKFNIKFIFDMRGFWADERIDGKIWDLSKPHYKIVYKYFKKKEKLFLKNADAIVSLTHKAKEIMQNEWGVKKDIYVIPCAVDTSLFKAESEKTEQANGLTIGYLGSIGTWYMLDEMLDFFKVLLDKYPKAKFKFITKETPATILNKVIAREIPVANIEIVSASRDEVPKHLQDIDLGIFFIKPAFSKQASSPVKQGEFMSMQIPVITNAGIGDTDDIINKYKSGISLTELSYETYKKTVENLDSLLSLPKSGFVNGTNEYFSLIKGNQTYLQLYKDLGL